MNTPTKSSARLAGALYFGVGLTAPFSLLYVPQKLIVPGDATATAGRILASETLFRLGMLAELLCGVVTIFLVMALYGLLSGVNKRQAALMVIFALIPIPISFFGVINEIAALAILRGARYLSVFDLRELHALAMFFLGMRGKGIVVSEIFWGLWLVPFGLLVMRSKFLPRILGVLLIINGFAYLAISFTSLLVPAYAAIVSRYALVAEFGELWIMLWLVIRGVNVPAPPPAEALG